MQTLSHGINKPQNGDRGSTLFDGLAANAQKQNDHTHDGTDAERVACKNLSKGTKTVLSTDGWSGSASAWYAITVTMPTGYTWGNCQIVAFDPAVGQRCYAEMTYVTSTTFQIKTPIVPAELDLIFI